MESRLGCQTCIRAPLVVCSVMINTIETHSTIPHHIIIYPIILLHNKPTHCTILTSSNILRAFIRRTLRLLLLLFTTEYMKELSEVKEPSSSLRAPLKQHPLCSNFCSLQDIFMPCMALAWVV